MVRFIKMLEWDFVDRKDSSLYIVAVESDKIYPKIMKIAIKLN